MRYDEAIAQARMGLEAKIEDAAREAFRLGLDLMVGPLESPPFWGGRMDPLEQPHLALSVQTKRVQPAIVGQLVAIPAGWTLYQQCRLTAEQLERFVAGEPLANVV